jgi:hypothetical protein
MSCTSPSMVTTPRDSQVTTRPPTQRCSHTEQETELAQSESQPVPQLRRRAMSKTEDPHLTWTRTSSVLPSLTPHSSRRVSLLPSTITTRSGPHGSRLLIFLSESNSDKEVTLARASHLTKYIIPLCLFYRVKESSLHSFLFFLIFDRYSRTAHCPTYLQSSI